ncbi:conserved hypothetical protein [Ricinus communis]|uniref:Uncharacterized protein n=1 Tax=Ricinus communis TaxID=3988 RepID=B9TP56_RICCO|nr:conserved hypothetical protein [Ricinus communis]
MARDRHLLEIERLDRELGPEEGLVEVDDGVARARRMRHHVQPVRQHEAQVARAEGPRGAADQLPRLALDADLDLEVLVAVRAREHVARALEADVEIEVVGALLHAVEAMARARSGHRAMVRPGSGCCLRPAFA